MTSLSASFACFAAALALLAPSRLAEAQQSPREPPPASFLFAGPVGTPLPDGRTAVLFRYVVAVHSVTPTRIEVIDAGTSSVLVSDDAPAMKQSGLKHPTRPGVPVFEWSGQSAPEIISDSQPAWLYSGTDTRLVLELRVHSADQAPISFRQQAVYSRAAKLALIESREFNRRSHAAPAVLSLLGKDWKVGHVARNAQQQLTEFVSGDQTVQSWTELLTRQVIVDPSSQVSIARLLELIRQGFGPDCKGMQWTVHRQTDTEVHYSWSHNGCDRFAAQAERASISRVQAGLCRRAYATRSTPITPDLLATLDVELAKLPC